MRSTKNKFKLVLLGFFSLFAILSIFFFSNNSFNFLSRALYRKANLVIDLKKFTGPLPHNWKAIAQGGEEKGVRMFEPVIYSASTLDIRYIRIDHVYDFYDVVTRNNNGSLNLNWDQLDQTVCDIYHIGARPFFVLGYMPPDVSVDGSLIGQPKDWQEWSYLVQKTIERYSGKSTRLCGGVYGDWFKNIYYEVWNEPDLETFGKWSLYNGPKDYKILYYYSSQGADLAQNVNQFYLGGPVTTKAYRNWFIHLIDYIENNKLRMDFISWHHYSNNTDDYAQDIQNIKTWLSPAGYAKYAKLPKIISEWGYDSAPNPIAHTSVGAAHTVATVRNLIEEKIEMAFLFDMKDGPNPGWGIFNYEGSPKPRAQALKMLNVLGRHRLQVEGEGTFVKSIAALNSPSNFSLVLVNYDLNNTNTESVPIKIANIKNGSYTYSQTDLNAQKFVETLEITDNQFTRNLLMPPNSVFTLEFTKL